MSPRVPFTFLTLVILFTLALAVPVARAAPDVSDTDPLALLAVQRAELTAANGADCEYFGRSVALDGDTALIGADGRNTNQGAVYVFVRSESTWTQRAELTASNGAAGDRFGYSVALDGDTALVGAYGRDSERGTAYVFTGAGDSWTQRAELTASNGAAGDRFGQSLTLDGDTALIGAYGRDSYRGAAYVFTCSEGIWGQQAQLTDSDAAGDRYGYYGFAVALDGDTALIGAHGRDSQRGAAYVFTRSGDAWSLKSPLTAADAGTSCFFGCSVALDDGTALIGSYGRDSNRGAAYVFTGSGGAWSQQAELTAADGAAGDFFGRWSVALDGDTALIGAYGRDSNRGAAYVCTGSGDSWSQPDELTAADGGAADCFGQSIALDGDTALIGAPKTLESSPGQGAVYVFAPPAPTITTVTPAAKRGTSVTISGSNFGAVQGESSVSFGSTACAEYTSWADTTIVCTVPAGAAVGEQGVTVTTTDGSSDPVGFTVLPYDAPGATINGADAQWRSSPVELTVTATLDSLLALSALEYSTDGGSTWTDVPGSGATRTLTISAEGTTTVKVRVTDSATQTAGDSATVKIDSETPTIAVSGNDDAWHAAPATLTFTPAAGPSGVAGVECKLNDGSWTTLEPTEGAYTLIVSDEGETTVSYRASSGAGLTSTVGSCTVKIDTQIPTITVSGNDDAWHAAPVTLTFTPAAGPSGVGSVEYKLDKGEWTALEPTEGADVLTVSDEGETTVSYRASSGAGLASDTASVTVKIDTARPKAKAKKATFKRGKTGKLRLYVAKKPAGCAKAKVTVRVYKGKKLLKRFATGYLTVNTWRSVKCPKLKKLAKGRYTLKVSAVDKLGNKQSGQTKTTLRVK